MVSTKNISEEIKKILGLLENVVDPEVPVLTVLDLGIIRKIEFINDKPVITITTTYSGCPATDVINQNIKLALIEAGYQNAEIKNQLFPAWTTDWMSEEGQQKLKQYGIAPPDKKMKKIEDGVDCPNCNSHNTRLISEFGSTACKALYQCSDCHEPFDYFKCH
jgi:ring-1,2-phenylacetyl-CoA epoxidase subunit PaaD